MFQTFQGFKNFAILSFDSEFMNFLLAHCKFILSHYKLYTPRSKILQFSCRLGRIYMGCQWGSSPLYLPKIHGYPPKPPLHFQDERMKKRMESEPPLDLATGFAPDCRKFVLAHFQFCAPQVQNFISTCQKLLTKSETSHILVRYLSTYLTLK